MGDGKDHGTELVVKRSFSSESLELPWHIPKRPKKVRILVSEVQTGRRVTPDGFILCFMAVLLLASSMCLFSAALWSIVRKLPYNYLINMSVEIAYFTIPASLLGVPCCWIAASIHNNRKNFTFIPLIIFFMVCSLALYLTGAFIHVSYDSNRTNHANNYTKKYALQIKNEIRVTMKDTMDKYDSHEDFKYGWDRTQEYLKCCGIEDAKDWTESKKDIPKSCCKYKVCSMIYVGGCLHPLAYELAYHQNVLKSLNIAGAVLQISGIIITGIIYFCLKE